MLNAQWSQDVLDDKPKTLSILCVYTSHWILHEVNGKVDFFLKKDYFHDLLQIMVGYFWLKLSDIWIKQSINLHI